MGNILGRVSILPTESEYRKLEILRRAHDFPVKLRETIDGYKDEDPESFLLIVEERLVDLLYGINGNGLDCNRDTQEEVETAIRFFPHALCEKYWGTYPPIYAQLAYIKSVPFVPLLAKLGIELNQFQEEERGGLFYYQWRVLQSLVNNDSGNWYDEDNEDQMRLVDERYAAALQSLREMGIFQRDDITEENLMWEMKSNKTFPEQRFRCLVDLEPNILSSPYQVYRFWPKERSARVFRIVFEIGMLHFPAQLGFLFHIRKDPGYTHSFGWVCQEYGTEKVTEIIGDVLAKRYPQSVESNDERMKLEEEALIHAATNPNVLLDGVYFLLRRDPGRYCQQAIASSKRCQFNE